MADTNLPDPKQGPRSTPLSSEINSLSDYQLKKLTRSNTKKNVGGKKNRFLSQLERVCRRLELLNVTPQVEPETQTHSLHAIPIVNPDGSTFKSLTNKKEVSLQINENEQHQGQHEEELEQLESDQFRIPIRTQTPRFCKDAPFSESTETHNSEDSATPEDITEDDDFDIEPATVGSTNDDAISTATTTKSLRSVRISTEVTILGFSPRSKRGEPMSLSVSTMRRTEHPTRNGKSFLLRPRSTKENRFPCAMSALDRAKRMEEIEALSRDDTNSTPQRAMDKSSSGSSPVDRSNPVLLYAKGSPRRPQSRTNGRFLGGSRKPEGIEAEKK